MRNRILPIIFAALFSLACGESPTTSAPAERYEMRAVYGDSVVIRGTANSGSHLLAYGHDTIRVRVTVRGASGGPARARLSLRIPGDMGQARVLALEPVAWEDEADIWAVIVGHPNGIGSFAVQMEPAPRAAATANFVFQVHFHSRPRLEVFDSATGTRVESIPMVQGASRTVQVVASGDIPAGATLRIFGPTNTIVARMAPVAPGSGYATLTATSPGCTTFRAGLSDAQGREIAFVHVPVCVSEAGGVR